MGKVKLAESWRIFTTHIKPRRLLQEDPGVKGPLWFGKHPDSEWHFTANALRLFCAIIFAPIWLFVPWATGPRVNNLLKRFLWGIEWSHALDAVLLEAPRSLIVGDELVSSTGKNGHWNGSDREDEDEDEGDDEDDSMIREKPLLKKPRSQTGQYAVTGNKPLWILEVVFEGDKITSQKQVRFQPKYNRGTFSGNSDLSKEDEIVRDARELERNIHLKGYTTLSYAMKSAEVLFIEQGRSLRPQPMKGQMGERDYSNENRQLLSQIVLDEYTKSRKTVGEGDGLEYIWLDEYCLHDAAITDDKEAHKYRDREVGHLADIFRNAKRVVVFCHIVNCKHTGINCPWANRLFTIGEILYTPQVLQMTRSKTYGGGISSFITVLPGHEFRADMQARAARAKKWHLYNIMQHATNSGAVPWQSAIHSLVVEAIRRDEVGGFNQHRLLGKALNGLLPRRSQLSDLRGRDGWADLAWLLELNQGYYNTALLAAVCKIADHHVKEYRWWGKPIEPKEGWERLEPLVTAIPVKLRKTSTCDAQPALSLIGPKAIALGHMLQRDSGGLHSNIEMKPLEKVSRWIYSGLVAVGFVCFAGGVPGIIAGAVLIYTFTISFAIFELLVGTIFVRKDEWIVIDDHIIPGRDPHRYILSQDPTFSKAAEWGPRQMTPQFDLPHPKGPAGKTEVPRPYAITLFDMRTGVFVRTAVTGRPNDMVILAVHGSGITCMLLDRDDDLDALKTSVAVKVGMANLPTFVVAQSEVSATIYVGGGPIREKKKKNKSEKEKDLIKPLTSIISPLSQEDNGDVERY